MRIDLRGDWIVLYDATKAIANMLPGVKYDKATKLFYAPLEAAQQLCKTLPQYCSDAVLQLGRSMQAAEDAVEELKKKGFQGRHPILMRHQALCLEIANIMPSYGFFAETGTGKTLIGLSIIKSKPDDIKWLVVCPKNIIETAWLEDAATFYPDIKIMPWHKSMTKHEVEQYAFKFGDAEPQKVAQVLVCNYESFRLMQAEFIELGVRGVIFDESACIKSPTAQVTKAAVKFSTNMAFKYVLSGIPAPNSELDYFSQMQVIDPSIFGDNFWSFRNHWFVTDDYFQHHWVLNPALRDMFIKQLGRRSIVIRKQDCLDLPEVVSIKRKVQLSDNAMSYYRKMHRDRVLELAQGGIVTAVNKLTQLMKLRQITSGFIIDNDSNDNMLHTDKLNELLRVLEDLGDEQAIIWCNFKNEIRAIKKALGDKAVTAYSETDDVNQSINDFKSGKAQYIIAHPKSLKYGVTLTNCTYAIYYSLSYSYDDFAQSRDRIHRIGQRDKATLIFLLAEDTIDEVIYDVVQGKQSIDEAVKQILAMGAVM